VLDAHVAAHALELALSLLDVDPQVEVLEDAVEERERALDVDGDAEQAADGREEARLQRREGDECADDRARRRPVGDLPAAEPVDGLPA
jgi:hypothetical protein